MDKRARKSAASLTIAHPTELCPRLAPPPELSEYEASIWHRVVNTKPAEWFKNDTEQLLISYCRHCSQASIVDIQLKDFEPGWLADKEGLDRYEKLCRLRDLQSKQINALSRSMRLTQQSQYDAAKAGRKSGGYKGAENAGKKPWEI